MIPDDQVEEVRARADIVDVIGEIVSLKKAGKEFKARCPFHDERTPSFYVVPDKGFYKCFGCGESGDVFSFVMKRLGLDFVEAVKHVAERAGVEIRETRGRDPEEDPYRPFYEANAFARDFYRQCLEDEEVGRLARDYLESRGVDAETAERFGVGYAPDDWRALRDAAARHEMDDALLMEVGLLTTSEKAPEPYDRFRDRIIFPIEGLGGRVVAFGGRVLGKGEHGPKYLNSPETPIYHKGEVLYGLSWAKHAVRREGGVLVVEGYMDLVALGAGGFDNVVATLGTALTERHAELLSRYTKRAYLLFDSDAAGLRATFKGGDTLLAAGLHPSVVTLPPGEDPDTLVQKEGSAGLQHYVDQAVDVLDRKLQILDEHDYFRDIEKTRQAVDRLLPTLRSAADPALRDIYVSKVAEKTGVRTETLEAEMRRSSGGRSGGAGAGRGRSRAGRRDRTSARRTGPLPRMGAERSLLLLMLRNREFVERAGEHLGPGDFADEAYRAIFEAFLDDPALEGADEVLDPVAARRVQELREDPEEVGHARDVFEASLSRVRQASLKRRRGELDRRIREVSDPGEADRLRDERRRINEELRELGPDMSGWARALSTMTEDTP